MKSAQQIDIYNIYALGSLDVAARPTPLASTELVQVTGGGGVDLWDLVAKPQPSGEATRPTPLASTELAQVTGGGGVDGWGLVAKPQPSGEAARPTPLASTELAQVTGGGGVDFWGLVATRPAVAKPVR